MVMYQILFSERAEKDKILLKQGGLDEKAKALLDIIANSPFQNPPPYERLQGAFKGHYSRRINIQHRLDYTVNAQEKIIIIFRMWSHYA